MIMMKFRKGYNLRIVATIAVMLFLSNVFLYAAPCFSTREHLRLPLGDYKQMGDILNSREDNKKKDWSKIEKEFKILIDSATGEDELKGVYRKMAKETHPDVNPNDIKRSTKTFQELAEYMEDRLLEKFDVHPSADNSNWMAAWAAGKSFSAVDSDGNEFGRFVIDIGSPKKALEAKTRGEIEKTRIETIFPQSDIAVIAGIRTANDDVFGIERKQYLEHVDIGSLPDGLRERTFSYPWPIDMTDSYVHIVGFYGEIDLLGESKDEHLAADIQARVGTEVHAVEDGFVVFVQHYDDRRPIDSKAYSFADVWVYSPASNLLWLYVHLDKSSIPPRILKHHWFNRDEAGEEFKIKAGDVIGKVNKWHTENTLENIDIPESVESVYGRTYNHLHLEVRYVDDLYTGFGVDHLTPVNPLHVLRPLYDLSRTDFPSRASRTTL